MKYWWLIITVVVVLVIMVLGIWFFFFRSNATLSTDAPTTGSFFGTDSPNTTTTNNNADTTNGTQAVNTTASNQQKIFKITGDPIVGATLMQTLRPTTTIARYIRQDDGHVFDVPLGVSGAVPRVISNVTIPGGSSVIWVEGGNGALMQYLDDSSVVKTVYLGFPVATTSRVSTTRIQFLPDDIITIAATPDGKNIVYLLKTQKGSDGYVANADGTNSKKLFSLPLSQVLVSWPSQNTIVVQTKSAVGILGAAFKVDVKSGLVASLVNASGLSVLANKDFTMMLYQNNDGTTKNTYIYDLGKGLNAPLGFNPIPEKCLWSTVSNLVVYCATELDNTDPNYLDLWHQGIASVADAISVYNIKNNTSSIVTYPGGKDGGNASDILEMSLSPDEHYLSYTTKGGRSLWGVLLSK